ncbi:hypothetical protein A33Q_2529 [Indibacter alkaliphilus LW1]|uniref:DUF1648 domain-containing protein n=1 Tax=Indibacter alkaliphilus (strain CCUG 57479 / KCTC 22604 / LW1) TaxID=1189612 RepID=S2DV13_INDAL|nr:hypothetical protein [Indibacter alkaliphilus]EOZ95936.1 hypothetical protein A33Q_2529 [Indibacter alkaliphilus LW1]
MEKEKVSEQSPETSLWDKVLEILGFAALILLWSMTYYFQHKGAESVAADYNFFANPSEYWASNMTYSIPIIASILFLGITFYNQKPRISDYTIKNNPEKADTLIQINTRLWRWLKFTLILMFLLIEYFSFHSGSGFGTGIPTWFIIVFPIVLFAPVVYFFMEFAKNQLD